MGLGRGRGDEFKKGKLFRRGWGEGGGSKLVQVEKVSWFN
jgi:hypothetical protein